MNYIIHVIDNASIFQKGKDKFELIKSLTEKDEQCQVLLSESFYKTEAPDASSAVAVVINTIRVKTKTGDKIPISQCFLETAKSLSSSDFNQDMPDTLLTDLLLKREINPYSVFITASFHLEREEGIIELHRVEFYVVEETKIMEIV